MGGGGGSEHFNLQRGQKGLEVVEPNVPDLTDLHLAMGEDEHCKQSKLSWLLH